MEVREARAEYLAKPGVKQTEVGEIPEDWTVQSINSIAQVKGGKRLPLGWFVTDKITAHPYLRVTDMRPGIVELGDIKYVPEGAFPPIQNYRIFVDDIFISVAGSLGIVGKIPPQIDGANLTENANRITSIQCIRDYLLYYLLSDKIQSAIEGERTVGAQPKLALNRIEAFQVALPPTLQEQQAIADALGDADALIESLEHLLAKKRQIKQGTMQALLTGQQRLPGFEGAWKSTSLGSIGDFLKGAGISRDEAQSGDLPCIRYGEIYTSHHDIIRCFRSYISRGVAAKAIRLKRGDILFAGSGETKEEIGKCVALIEDIEAYAGGDIVILRPQGTDPTFLGYALNTSDVNRQKASRGQGDAVVHISATALAQVVIQLPEEREQTAIATVLTDMDAEITALDAKLAKARALKQGMMQTLLTGRIRLV